MKVKALKTFIFGRYEAAKGEVTDLSEPIAKKLIKIGFVEAEDAADAEPEGERDQEPKPDKDSPAATEEANEGSENVADKTPAADKKTTKTGKSGAKSPGKK